MKTTGTAGRIEQLQVFRLTCTGDERQISAILNLQ